MTSSGVSLGVRETFPIYTAWVSFALVRPEVVGKLEAEPNQFLFETWFAIQLKRVQHFLVAH